VVKEKVKILGGKRENGEGRQSLLTLSSARFDYGMVLIGCHHCVAKNLINETKRKRGPAPGQVARVLTGTLFRLLYGTRVK